MQDIETPQPVLAKGLSSMQFSEEEIKKILRAISVELQETGIEDFKDKVYEYDEMGLLTESEFERCVIGLKVQLTNSEVTSLVNKYYDILNKKVHVKQLLEDLEKYAVPGILEPPKMSKSKSSIMTKVAKYVAKQKRDNSVIDEMFMMDKYSEGTLTPEQIKTAFHNGGIKLSISQVDELLLEIRADRNKR